MLKAFRILWKALITMRFAVILLISLALGSATLTIHAMRLTAQVAELTIEAGQLAADLARAQSRVVAQSRALRTLRTNLTSATTDLAQTRSRVVAQSRALGALRTNLASTSAQVSRFNRQLSLLQRNTTRAVAAAVARERAKARLRRMVVAVPAVGSLLAAYYVEVEYQEWLEENPGGDRTRYACEVAQSTSEIIQEEVESYRDFLESDRVEVVPAWARPNVDTVAGWLESWRPECEVRDEEIATEPSLDLPPGSSQEQ